MSRASDLEDYKYDPNRVKGVIDEEIESNRAAGKWEFAIDNLIDGPRDKEKTHACLDAVKETFQGEGFYASFSIGGMGGGPFLVVTGDPTKK